MSTVFSVNRYGTVDSSPVDGADPCELATQEQVVAVGERVEQRHIVYRLMDGSTCLWLDYGSVIPSYTQLPVPRSVVESPTLRTEILYAGTELRYARNMLKFAAAAEPPRYERRTEEGRVSRLRLSDNTEEQLFWLSRRQPTDLVIRATLFAQTKRMRLKHLYRFARLYGQPVEQLANGVLVFRNPVGMVWTLQNSAETCDWRLDVLKNGLRWRGRERVSGWLGLSAVKHMQLLWHRQFGAEYVDQRMPDPRIVEGRLFRLWKAGKPIPKSSMRPVMLRAQGWNPSMSYRNWLKALELGVPQIRWID